MTAVPVAASLPAGAAPASPSGTAPVLAIRNVAVRYGDAASVFRGVGFAVAAGEAVALLGANGAGKSSLLRCCVGLLRPAEGAVRLFGEEPWALPPRRSARLRSRCGFVAQKHNLVPRLSVLSNVVHGLIGTAGGPLYWLQGLAPSQARASAMAALARVGIADLATRRADRLSGGQSQRVAIARALVAEPDIVFADEPAASLDPAAGEEVMALLLRLARESGTAVLFTTHNVDHAIRYSDRVLALKDGGLALDAAAGELIHSGLRRLYG